MTKTIVVVLLLSLAIVFVGSVLVALLQMLPTDETFEPPPTEPRARDITIGKDQYPSERLARLRALQTGDIDVLRKAHPAPPTSPYDEAVIREESRRALERLKKGW